MINAFEQMTIFNAISGPDRRESYFPTRIGGITWTESSSLSGDNGHKNMQDKYTIRIPITAHIQEDRTYLPPEEYKKLPIERISQHWTIQEGDYIFPKHFFPSRWKWDEFSFRTGTILKNWEEIEGSIYYGKDWKWDTFSFRYGRIKPSKVNDIGTYLKKAFGKLIIVTSVADNTKRGSPRVQHWKIGGA